VQHLYTKHTYNSVKETQFQLWYGHCRYQKLRKVEKLRNIKCLIKIYLAGETCSGPNPCFAGLQVRATLLPTSNVFWALVWQCLLEAQRA
jgi:hypothetical protein